MVSQKIVRTVSKIAKLQLDEKEVEQYTKEFNDILELFSTLESAPTTEEFTLTPIEVHPPLRKDVACEKEYKESGLELTPYKTSDYFKGPKTI